MLAVEPFGWREIYDVIEAIGLEDIHKHYGVSKQIVRDIHRTANHHRHVGNPQYPLPFVPPAEEDARATIIKVVVQRYFARHVKGHAKSL